MRCTTLFITALSFLAYFGNASDDEYEGSTLVVGDSLADAVISILTVHACKYGAEITDEPPPSGIRCRMKVMDLVAEFMVPDSTIPKVVSCVHLNVQQKVQIRDAIEDLIEDVLHSGEKQETSLIVGTRSSVKLNLTGYPFYESYPMRYVSYPNAKDINTMDETMDSITEHFMTKAQITSPGPSEVSMRAWEFNPLEPQLPYCSSIVRLSRKKSTLRDEYLAKVLKDNNLPTYSPLANDRPLVRGKPFDKKTNTRRSGCCVSQQSDEEEDTRRRSRKGSVMRLLGRSLSLRKSKKKNENSGGTITRSATVGARRSTMRKLDRTQKYADNFHKLAE